MKKYKEVFGKISDGNNPNDETKIPKTADDLQYSDISLDLRQRRLNSLMAMKKSLKDMQLKLVFIPKNGELSKIDNVRDKIRIIRTKIDINKLVSPCEYKTCVSSGKSTPIYLNLCHECFPSLNTSDIKYDLMSIRNLLVRMSYLEEHISSSLSNQISKEDLLSAVNEVSILETCIA